MTNLKNNRNIYSIGREGKMEREIEGAEGKMERGTEGAPTLVSCDKIESGGRTKNFLKR